MLSTGVVEAAVCGRGRPIVMLPGLAGGTRLLAPLARFLAPSHQVFMLGLRGDSTFGERMPAESVSDFARDVLEALDVLDLDAPLLMGVSFGAAVALEAAALASNRISGLIVQGGDMSFEAGLGHAIALKTLKRYALPRNSAFLNQFFNILYGCKPEPGPLFNFIVESCWSTDQAEMARRLEMLELYDVSDRLWRIETPTTVVAGTRDVVVRYERQRTLASALPSARFVSIRGGGHVAFLTHAMETALAVLQTGAIASAVKV